MPDTTIIVVNWNTREFLHDCLGSIARTAGDCSVDVAVVDNASTDGSREMVQREFPDARLITNADNVGFSRANNQAASPCRTPYLLLLNSDAQLQPGALQAMLRLAEGTPRAGIVGAQLRNGDGSFQASHLAFPNLGQELLVLSGLGRLLYGQWYPSCGPDDGAPRRVDWVGGACMLVRREAFGAVGGFDEGFFMYAEEMDLCYRMQRAGWEVWYEPAARVIHLGGGSSRTRRTLAEGNSYRGRVRFFRKHYGGRAAATLKLAIYAFTAVKIAAHGLARLLSGGRYGREVVPLRRLAAELRRE